MSDVAGVRNKRTTQGKKPTGPESILKMVKENQSRADLMAAVQDQSKIESCAAWHVKSETNNHAAAGRRKAAMAEEVQMANVSIKLSRTAALKELYAAEEQQLKQELLQLGLAVEKDRV